LRQCILEIPETANSGTAFFASHRCIKTVTPLRQYILEIPETVNSGTALFASHRCIRAGTPLRQCILETPQTLIFRRDNCLTVSRVHCINTLPRCIKVGTPLRQCILDIPETVNSGIAFFITHRCIKAGTPLRQCILETPEIVDGEITGKHATCSLPVAMLVRRQQEEAMVVNSNRRVTALSRVLIEGGTPMRQLTVETVNGEIAVNYVMSPVSRTQTSALPRPGIDIAASAHPRPGVSRICCLIDTPSGDTGRTQDRWRGIPSCYPVR
jgi:hypothetical protein